MAKVGRQQLCVDRQWYYWSAADRVFIETGSSQLAHSPQYEETNRETVADVPSDSQYSFRVF